MTLGGLALCLAGHLLVAGCREPGAFHTPNIVLISADALRADHLSFSGYARKTSPRLDAFAASAWQFTNAVCVLPKTGPAIATIFSGLYPNEHKVEANRYAIPGDVPLLAEMLRARGYRTAAFVSNPVLAPGKGYARGFDVFETVEGIEATNRAFTSWASSKWSAPTFAWIHYIDPHGPYTPPERFSRLFRDDDLARDDRRRVSLGYRPIPGFSTSYVLGAVPEYQRLGNDDRVAHYVDQYDGEVRFVDEAFGEIVDFVRREKSGDTAVVFTSDHGESLGEHNYYFEHGWFVYEDSLRVPLLIHAPAQTRAMTVSEQVSSLDLLPTLLGLAGLTPPRAARGRDLLSGRVSDEPLMISNSSTYPQRYFGLRTAGWKYVWTERSSNVGAAVAAGTEELFDLRADPDETIDVARKDPERLASMRAELQKIRASTRAPEGRKAVPASAPSPKALRDLKSLGYVN